MCPEPTDCTPILLVHTYSNAVQSIKIDHFGAFAFVFSP